MALKFVRNVICQRFPRDLMVIDAIQREVLTASNLTAGAYAVFAEQTENLFMPSALFALDEYGVPIQTAQRLASRLLPARSLDTVLARLVDLPLEALNLTAFETEILEEVRRTLAP